jgi:uncharacterized protein YegL
MNGHHDPIRQEKAAEELEKLLAALQAGQPAPPTPNLSHEDRALARAITQAVKQAQPPEDFSAALEQRLLQSPLYQPGGPRRHLLRVWAMAAAAVLMVALLGFAAVFTLSDGGDEDGDSARQSDAVSMAEATSTPQEAAQSVRATDTPIAIAATVTPNMMATLLVDEADNEDDADSVADAPPDPGSTFVPGGPTTMPGLTGMGSATPTPLLDGKVRSDEREGVIANSTLTVGASLGGSPVATYPPPTRLPDSGGGPGDGGNVGQPPPSSTPAPTLDAQFQSSLEAGEIDDNEEFSAYLQFRASYARYMGLGGVHEVDIVHRHAIRVQTAEGRPVIGAEVLVYDRQENLVTTLHTTATGLAYFFPRAYPDYADETAFLVEVRQDEGDQNFPETILDDEVRAVFELTREATDREWVVTLDVPPAQPPVQLDVLFLLDSTGSMSDEIKELKDNILSMSQQIDGLPAKPDVRYGLVTYRDRGDAYVTRRADFTPDVRQFQSTLAGVQAGGGGDYPESLNQALHEAVWEVEWRGPAAVKLIILVADAPPHLDYQQDYDYAQEMRTAASRGIKIHTIASSGLDNQGEYIFRQLAQFTGGHFIFLAYDSAPQSASSNEPGAPGTTHHVPETAYTVEYLDGLVVRLIEEELALLMGEADTDEQ